jgi:hypothetical protein
MISIDVKSKGRIRIDSSKDLLVQHQHVRGANYSGLKASFTAVGCTFEQCDFRDMRPRHVTFAGGLEQTRYVDCFFDRSRFARVVPGQSRFERCSFLDVEIKGLFGHMTEFVDCKFSGALRASVFYGRVAEPAKAKRTTNEFRGNDFSGAEFSDVGFLEGIDLSLQRLPVGENYLYLKEPRNSLLALRAKYLQLAASPLRQDVFHFLEACEKDLSNGQHELFLCKDSEVSMSAGSVDAIWAELRKDS